MNAPLVLSPVALAAASVPEGVMAMPVGTRDDWLAWRANDVTASVAAALFGDGCHPYVTAYKLWALKSGLITEDPETPAMRRGRLLEPAHLELLREEYPTWNIQPCQRYYRDPNARIGATPDLVATRTDIAGFGIIQQKSVGRFAYKKGWKDEDGDMRTPLFVGVQCATEAALTGASWAMVSAMELGDGGLELHDEDVPLQPALMAKLRGLVKDFWRRVEEYDPYPPEFNRDAALIGRLYDGESGPVIDLGADEEAGNLLDDRAKLKAREKDGALACEARKEVDAQLLAKLGNASGATLADGRSYSVKLIRRKAYEVKASQYPVLTVKG